MLKLNKRGQNVVEVTVLISFSLVVVVATTYFAFNVLEYQSEQSEYESAKTALEKLTLLIENAANSEGSSGYVPLYLRAGSLYLAYREEPIVISVNGVVLNSTKVNLIEYKGGRLVGTVSFRLIRPTSQDLQSSISLDDLYTNYLIIPPDKNLPLGWLYEKQENGAFIVGDFGRIRVTFSGTFNYSYIENNTVKFKLYNVVEVTFIKITLGNAYGGGNPLKIVAKCNDVYFRNMELSGTSLTFTVNRGSYSQNYVFNGPTQSNGKNVAGTIVNFSLIEIMLSSY